MSNPTFEDYFKQLTPSSVILTPNRRLAAVLHEHYIAYQQQQNVTCWQKPTILSINAWLESLWSQYLVTTTTHAPCLLNTIQASMLWETIVAQDTSHHLLQIAPTAEALKSAWELIWQYNINLEDPAFALTDDYALCQQWLLQYQIICKQKNYIDSAILPNFLSDKVTSGEINLPGQIWLYGFTEVIPQFEKLFLKSNIDFNTTVERRIEPGCVLSLPIEGRRGLGIARSASTGMYVPDIGSDSTQPGSVSLQDTVTLPDPDSEIIAMARFAKATLEANPEATIGCVVLDLNQCRERVLQLFTQVFFPDKPFDVDPINYPFNISAGKSLSSYPIIATALAICSLTNENLTREQFSAILLSPYIGGAVSKGVERAKLDAELRRENVHVVDVTKIRSLDPGFHRDDGNAKTFSEWAQHFNNKLAEFGWPGEKSLSSEEYQVAQAWLSVLTDFSSLDKTSEPVSIKLAAQHLKQIATSHIFQPQSPKTNIQVLGLLEAAGVPFDYLWVAGMNDMNWPPQPNPHPFIPKPLQRELNMPHATAERELSFCTTILEQFQTAAKHLIFSHAESDGKIEFKRSSLLQEIPAITLSSIAQATYIEPASKLFACKNTEYFSDAIAPAITDQQKVTGGADIIKQQAACPFRAFATHRLQARELETSTQGLNPKDRGIILHDVMQRFWSEVGSQKNLQALDEDELQTIINNNIVIAIKENAPSHHHDTRYIALEQIRLNKIVNQWLELEKVRPPFEVSTQEEAATITLHGRQLSVRIDRVDTLADGKKLIIDYKTSPLNSTNKWFGDRPDEPQLPLYALIDSDNTAGISFAQLAVGNLCFKGMSNEELNIHGIQSDSTWIEKLASWRATLEKLAENFIKGDAAINPKRPSVTCKNCAITPLCRIYEMTDPADDEVSEELDASDELNEK